LGIAEAHPAERHWVGTGLGMGRFWDRAGNWSATQGGPGGAGVPTVLDDVYIDGGGRTEINTTAVCLSFTQSDSGHETDFKSPGTLTVGAGGFSVTNGTFYCDMSNVVAVAGPWSVTAGTFLAGTGTVVLNGSSAQSVATNADFFNLTLNNAAGFTLSSDVTVANTLILSSGVVQTGTRTVILPATATVSRTGGHVFGNLRKHLATGPASAIFEVGGADTYAPVTVAFGNVTTSGNLTVTGMAGDHPSIGSSAINPALSVNRYWTLANDGVAFDQYSASFSFAAGDLDTSTNTSTFIVQRYASAAWNATTAGNRTATSTQATGLTSLGDFAVGNSLVNFTITAAAAAGGSITPSGAVTVDYGSDQSFTITPNTGYFIADVFVDSVSVGAVPEYTFTNVTANHTIGATFSLTEYTITATAGSEGSVSPSGAVPVLHGSTQGFTITPDAGFYIADVHVDTLSVGPVSSYTFNNILRDHTISATFAVQTFTVTALAGPHGSVSPPGATVVGYGDSLTVTVTPDSGYFVTDVRVDSVSVGVVPSYTFTNITADHLLEASFGTNTAPTAPLLASPADGDTIPAGMLGSVDFSWHPSSDADAGDVLQYTVSVTGPGVNYSSGGVADTTVTLDLSGLLTGGETYRWTVSVSDGSATVASPDTFMFLVNPGTAVGDGDVLPSSYALGQNYPNPFNPVTTIPFDLPERSSVTLKVYNILGAEVLTIVEGESMAAGSYTRGVEFANLSSGAYFYRISAIGESGTVFGKVMRLVVIR